MIEHKENQSLFIRIVNSGCQVSLKSQQAPRKKRGESSGLQAFHKDGPACDGMRNILGKLIMSQAETGCQAALENPVSLASFQDKDKKSASSSGQNGRWKRNQRK